MRWFDLAALTAIFFGPAMVASLSRGAHDSHAVPSSGEEFSTETNWTALIQQSLLLALGTAYLCRRRIPLVRWSMRPSLKGAARGVALFAFVGAVFDLAYSLHGSLSGAGDAAKAEDAGDLTPHPGEITLLLYSAFNAVYEEFFFLVLCRCVAPGHRGHRVGAFAYGLGVRSVIHSYQGLLNAVMIGVVFGSAMHAASRRPISPTGARAVRLFPVVVAHALADVFGVSVLSLVAPALQAAKRTGGS